MPIQSFSFPLPETRFFQAGQHVYKFKIRGGNTCSEVKVMGEEFVNRELENAIRAVLANLDCLQPFTTTHFTVYPYKSKWKRVSKFTFEKMSGEKLSAYPYLVTVYLENNTHTHTHTAMCVEECWTPVRAGEGVPLLPASPHERQAKRSKTGPPHWGTLIPQQRDTDCLIMQGPQSQIHHELLRPGETEAQNGDGKADCVVSDSQTPQSTVSIGGSVTGGSETTEVSGGHGEEEVHPGAVEEGDPEDLDLDPESHVRPGLLARLVRPLSSVVMCQWATSNLCVVMMLLLCPVSFSYEGLSPGPGCHLYRFNVTIRSDQRGTCKGTHVVYACVGYCESSAFPSRYSVLVASNFTHNITSASQCCTISKDAKIKVRLDCPRGRHHDDIEILTAQACRCDMCRKSRY